MNQYLANEVNTLKLRVTELEAARGTHVDMLKGIIESQESALETARMLNDRCSQLEDAVTTLLRKILEG